jgi:hypothetical protein
MWHAFQGAGLVWVVDPGWSSLALLDPGLISVTLSGSGRREMACGRVASRRVKGCAPRDWVAGWYFFGVGSLGGSTGQKCPGSVVFLTPESCSLAPNAGSVGRDDFYPTEVGRAAGVGKGTGLPGDCKSRLLGGKAAELASDQRRVVSRAVERAMAADCTLSTRAQAVWHRVTDYFGSGCH